MATCCEGRKDKLGAYDGTNVDEARELSRQQGELYKLFRQGDAFRFKESRVGERHADGDFEILFRCPQCGQLWTYHEGPRDAAIYTKITVEDARKQFPEFKG